MATCDFPEVGSGPHVPPLDPSMKRVQKAVAVYS